MNDERTRRWRMVLGKESDLEIPPADAQRDAVLDALYDAPRKGGLGPSSPNVSRWLGDIRTYFPTTVVQVMQRDAMKRLGLTKMLLEPESLSQVEPDVNLVATLLSLSHAIPAKTKDTARQVVRKVVKDLQQRLDAPLRQAVTGALSRSVRNHRPKLREIDWDRTIRKNLKHYQPEYRTIVPEHRVGFGRKGQALKDIVLALDQSGSMANSVIYAAVLGAVLASLPAVRTQVVAFDTAVVDLTETLHDPVELLFGVQLGGGTDIEKALAYCESIVRNPSDTIMVLISDLIEGGNEQNLIKRAAAIKGSGVNLIALLALSDEGKPMYDHEMAATFASLGIPAFACTPDQFPDLMATAIKGQDIAEWVSRNETRR